MTLRNLVQGKDLESYTDCNGKSMKCVQQVSYGDFYFLKSTILITRSNMISAKRCVKVLTGSNCE